MEASRKQRRDASPVDVGALGLPAAVPTGVPGVCVDTAQFLGIVAQSLHELGLRKAAAALEAEAGVAVDAAAAAVGQLRPLVMDGRWDDVLAVVGSVATASPADGTHARLLVLRQRYLELLDAGEAWAAMEVLREGIMPAADTLRGDGSGAAPGAGRGADLWAAEAPADDEHVVTPAMAVADFEADTCWSTPALHALASLALCGDSPDLRVAAKWDGPGATRDALCVAVQSTLTTGGVPHGRLLELLGQALHSQIGACEFHSTSLTTPSLLADHKCGPDALPGKCAAVLSHHDASEMWGVQFSPNGLLLAANGGDGSVLVWDVSAVGSAAPALLHTFTHPHPVVYTRGAYCCAWSPDGTKVAAGYGDGFVQVWDVGTGVPVFSSDVHHGVVTGVAWVSHDVALPPSTCFVSGGEDGLLQLHFLSKPSAQRWPVGRVTALAVAPSAPSEVIVLSRQQSLVFVSLATRVASSPRNLSLAPVMDLAVDATGDRVLLSAVDVALFDRRAMQVVDAFPGRTQEDYVTHPTFGGPEGRFVASGSQNGAVHVWHAATASHLLRLRGHAAHVNAVAWRQQAPALLASASDDGSVRLWVATGE